MKLKLLLLALILTVITLSALTKEQAIQELQAYSQTLDQQITNQTDPLLKADLVNTKLKFLEKIAFTDFLNKPLSWQKSPTLEIPSPTLIDCLNEM